MLKLDDRENALKANLKWLRQLSEQRVEVDNSIGQLKLCYGELTRMMDKVKATIRLLGGKVPAGNDDAGTGLLWSLTKGRRLNDERP
ncbi:hypothetical protein ES705_30537 [subsurface metagenome]